MANEDVINALNTKAVGIDPSDGDPSGGNLSLEALLLLVTTDKVRSLEEKTKAELQELRQRQKEVTFLHKLLRTFNCVTDTKGGVDLSKHPELKELLTEAQGMGVEVDLNKNVYTKDERDRLVDTIRTVCDDLNVQNDMQIQTITRLTNERYEAFQLARSILKPLHEDKINKARSIAGR